MLLFPKPYTASTLNRSSPRFLPPHLVGTDCPHKPRAKSTIAKGSRINLAVACDRVGDLGFRPPGIAIPIMGIPKPGTLKPQILHRETKRSDASRVRKIQKNLSTLWRFKSLLLAIVSCHTWQLGETVGTWEAASEVAVKCPFVNEIILPASAGTGYISLPYESIGMTGPVLPRSPHPPFAHVENLCRIWLMTYLSERVERWGVQNVASQFCTPFHQEV